MLVLRLEMWPRGNRQAARELGRIEISNVGEGLTEDSSNYVAEFEPPDMSKFPIDFDTVEIQNQNHNQSGWFLAKKVLEKMIGAR